MLADQQLLEKIIPLVQKLSPEYRLHLVNKIVMMLPTQTAESNTLLQFGKYKTAHQSELKDFAVAEWTPTYDELDGA